jgi:hypothetical protein
LAFAFVLANSASIASGAQSSTRRYLTEASLENSMNVEDTSVFKRSKGSRKLAQRRHPSSHATCGAVCFWKDEMAFLIFKLERKQQRDAKGA